MIKGACRQRNTDPRVRLNAQMPAYATLSCRPLAYCQDDTLADPKHA